MTENSNPKKLQIKSWLPSAIKQLSEQKIPSARLDSLLLLSDELTQDKSWVIAHPEYELTKKQENSLNKKLNRRKNHEPIAYIRGFQEFYRRNFTVTPATLVPRPESETIIEHLKQISYNPKDKLLDVGTGSGILSITSKLEIPELDVYATDISQSAIKIAKHNSRALSANINFKQQDLLNNDSQKYKFILANLPYVALDWKRSPETSYEPSTALFAPDNGQETIKKLISQSPNNLVKNGYLIIEADPIQHQDLINYAKQFNLVSINKTDYIITFRLS